jgi:serine/threonine protein kinase
MDLQTKRSDSVSRRALRAADNSFSSRAGRQRRISSRRSGTSNGSPSVGASFLQSFFSSKSAASRPPQEDDEGQEIGDHSQYIIGRQIAHGGFSVVREAVTIRDGQEIVHAVKIIRKQLPGTDEAENERIQLALEQEVKLWSTLNYKYILPLIEAHTTPFATYCITRYNRGGTLFDLMNSRRKLGEPGLDAYLAKRYTYQLGCAIRYLHEDMHIVHRDIKLDNCLLDMSDPRATVDGGNVLLCDFGMADYIRHEDRDDSPSPPPSSETPSSARVSTFTESNIGPAVTSTNVMGTINYAAPEVVNAHSPLFSRAADMWAFGVCMYALIVGRYPFQDSFLPRLAMLITRGTWNQELLLNSPAVRRDGAKVANLVRGCLEPDAEARYTVSQALGEEWYEGCREMWDSDEDGEPTLFGGWGS